MREFCTGFAQPVVGWALASPRCGGLRKASRALAHQNAATVWHSAHRTHPEQELAASPFGATTSQLWNVPFGKISFGTTMDSPDTPLQREEEKVNP